jgi:hypothetical protein
MRRCRLHAVPLALSILGTPFCPACRRVERQRIARSPRLRRAAERLGRLPAETDDR